MLFEFCFLFCLVLVCLSFCLPFFLTVCLSVSFSFLSLMLVSNIGPHHAWQTSNQPLSSSTLSSSWVNLPTAHSGSKCPQAMEKFPRDEHGTLWGFCSQVKINSWDCFSLSGGALPSRTGLKTAVALKSETVWLLEPNKVLIPMKALDLILLELDPEQVHCSKQLSHLWEKREIMMPQRCWERGPGLKDSELVFQAGAPLSQFISLLWGIAYLEQCLNSRIFEGGHLS